MGDLSGVQEHNAREYENEHDYPDNIQKNGSFTQAYYDRGDDDTTLKLQDLVKKRIEEDQIKLRKNSNVAIEIVMTINDKKVWENYSFKGFNSNCHKFLEEKFGKDSVIAKYEHLDESNPHVHFVVLPTVEKEIKWKNSKGEGSRKEIRIDTRSHTGGAKKLRKFQDEYFNYLNDYGDKLGVKVYRGTLKEEQTKEYIRQTNHHIAALRSKLSDLSNDIEKDRVRLEIKEKEAQKLSKEIEMENLKKKDDPKWKLKGSGLDNPKRGYFH